VLLLLQAAEYLRLATLLTPNRGSSELGAEAAHSAASLLALYADVSCCMSLLYETGNRSRYQWPRTPLGGRLTSAAGRGADRTRADGRGAGTVLGRTARERGAAGMGRDGPRGGAPRRAAGRDVCGAPRRRGAQAPSAPRARGAQGAPQDPHGRDGVRPPLPALPRFQHRMQLDSTCLAERRRARPQ
jgi:hypothetical protein